jgi:hypothetical protein
MFACLVIFFLIMHVLNLSKLHHLRIFNGVIHVIFMTSSIRAFLKHQSEDYNYLSGVAIGMVTSMIGIILFCIFQLVFLALSPEFMATLQDNIPYVGEYLTPFTAALSIFMEAVAISLIGSYVIMRILEKSMEKELREADTTTVTTGPTPADRI